MSNELSAVSRLDPEPQPAGLLTAGKKPVENLLPILKNEVKKAATELRLTDLTKEPVKGQCGYASNDISDILWFKSGIKTKLTTSRNFNTYYHGYLTIPISGQEIIIDPTIGQFVQGYNEIFIGTRQELKALVLDPETKLINLQSPIDAVGAFRRIWGETNEAFVFPYQLPWNEP